MAKARESTDVKPVKEYEFIYRQPVATNASSQKIINKSQEERTVNGRIQGTRSDLSMFSQKIKEEPSFNSRKEASNKPICICQINLNLSKP